MKILVVWTLFIEHHLYNPTKDCAHRWCWTHRWGKHSESISLTLSLCPHIVPHSNLYFTLQLFCSAGWKGGWKLVPTLMPEWGKSPWACCSLKSSSAPSTSQSQRWPGFVAVWLEAASSTWTSTWFLNGLQGGWKIGWTVRMEELWSAAQSPRVVPQGSKAGQITVSCLH